MTTNEIANNLRKLARHLFGNQIGRIIVGSVALLLIVLLVTAVWPTSDTTEPADGITTSNGEVTMGMYVDDDGDLKAVRNYEDDQTVIVGVTNSGRQASQLEIKVMDSTNNQILAETHQVRVEDPLYVQVGQLATGQYSTSVIDPATGSIISVLGFTVGQPQIKTPIN